MMIRTIAFAIAAVFSVSLGSVANAYGTEPNFVITDVAMTTTPTTKASEVCVLDRAPESITLFALPGVQVEAGKVKMVCAAK